MYMSEDYNSPQSVYWCLKPFVVLALPEDHDFWQIPEEAHPLQLYPDLPSHALISEPRHILCNTPEHHFLLSSGQDTKKDHKGREAKYGKFAYSSAFAFSVPIGQLYQQMAPDNTLALSFDNGEQWKVHWSPEELGIGKARIGSKGTEVPTLTGVWKPWPKFGPNVQVKTTLIPPVRRHPGWHVRVHEVRKPAAADHEWFKELLCIDNGFATAAETSNGLCIHEKLLVEAIDDKTAFRNEFEGWWRGAKSALIMSTTGASGVMDLSKALQDSENNAEIRVDGGDLTRAAANTNLMIQRTLIPSIKHVIDLQGKVSVFTFVTGVFAVEKAAGLKVPEIVDLWRKPPSSITLL